MLPKDLVPLARLIGKEEAEAKIKSIIAGPERPPSLNSGWPTMWGSLQGGMTTTGTYVTTIASPWSRLSGVSGVLGSGGN